MADPAEDDIEEKKRELQNSVATMIQEKMKRKGAAISETQRSKDLDRSILLLEINSGGDSAAVSFEVRRDNDDEFTGTIKDVEVNLRTLERLINAIDETVMARVFEVLLFFESDRPEGEDLALLKTIRERTKPRTIKLQLILKNTPISVLTNNPTGKLSEQLPGVKLETLALDYTCKDDNENTSAIINYLNTSAMPPIDRVEVSLDICGLYGVEFSDLVSNITQLSSLVLGFNDACENIDRDRMMPDAAEWSKLAELKKLRELNISCYSTGLKPYAFPKLPSWSEKSRSLETLFLQNVDAEQDFFSAFPQLTSFSIHYTYGETEEPTVFSTKTIEELIAEVRSQRRHLTNLKSVEINGSVNETTGGIELIRDLCLAIVENYNRDCPKLQTLTLDFIFPWQSYVGEDGNENIQQFLTNERFDRQALSHAPLKIVLPSPWLAIDRQAGDKQADILTKVQSAIENLALAVYHSGLQFLALSHWEMFGCVISGRQLDDILEGIKVAHQRPDALLKNLEIVNDDGPHSMTRRIVWTNSNFGGFEQQIELTHWGHNGTIGYGPKGEKEDKEESSNSQSREAATESEAEGEEEESDVSKSDLEEGSNESPSSGTTETESEMENEEEPSQSDSEEVEEQSVSTPSSSGTAASEGRRRRRKRSLAARNGREDEGQGKSQLKRRRDNDD